MNQETSSISSSVKGEVVFDFMPRRMKAVNAIVSMMDESTGGKTFTELIMSDEIEPEEGGCYWGDYEEKEPEDTLNHTELIKQPKDTALCLITSVLNLFENKSQVRKFLKSEKNDDKSEICLEDFNYFLEFCQRYYGDYDVVKRGLFTDLIRHYLRDHEQEFDMVGQWVLKGTKIKIDQLLLSKLDERNKSYLIVGQTTSNAELRAKCVRELNMLKLNKKRKAVDMLGPATEISERALLGRMRHRETSTGNKDDHENHAILIKFNEYGVPFKYDPGNLQLIGLFHSKQDINREKSCTPTIS